MIFSTSPMNSIMKSTWKISKYDRHLKLLRNVSKPCEKRRRSRTGKPIWPRSTTLRCTRKLVMAIKRAKCLTKLERPKPQRWATPIARLRVSKLLKIRTNGMLRPPLVRRILRKKTRSLLKLQRRFLRTTPNCALSTPVSRLKCYLSARLNARCSCKQLMEENTKDQ